MKLIDWIKVPRGTMTNYGEFISCDGIGIASVLRFLEDGTPSIRRAADYKLRIVPASRWTYHDGGECPVPEWVTCAVIYAAGRMPNHPPQIGGWMNTIAYRITGVDRAGGFTDCPDEVTE